MLGGIAPRMSERLILASASRARAAMLAAAGVEVEVIPAAVDEAAMKTALADEGAPPRDVADILAGLKAARVSARHPGRLVLGADQVLALEGRIFDKPRDMNEARAQLGLLRARRHELLSAAVICENGRPVWRHVDRVRLTMRNFTDAFVENYLARHGEALLETVGAYKLEQGGVVLFDRIDGDYFTVLGLPLLPLMAWLRLRGIAQE